MYVDSSTISELLQGLALVAVTVLIHAAALSWLLWRLSLSTNRAMSLAVEWLIFVRVAIACIFAHLVEIMIWAWFFYWEGSMHDLRLASYFSAVTYATIGYGDVVPPLHLRLLASMEGLTGILMCAWSGGFFFSVVTQVWNRRRAERGGDNR